MKKKHANWGGFIEPSLAKLLKVMRFTTAILLATALTASAGVHSQDAKVTLSFNGVKLTKLFKAIEKETGYRFVYSNDIIPSERFVTVNVKEKAVKDVLFEVLLKTPLKYRFDELAGIIVIGEKSETKTLSFTKTISGKVTNEKGDPLAGVTIQAKGTSNATTTKVDGSFSIEVADNVKVLVISFVDMETKEINITGKPFVQVSLVSKNRSLGEVVVIGYGTQSKKDVTGSIISVGAKQLERRPISTFDNALAGIAPGLDVITREGSPGVANTITLRGIGSISGGFGPLFVVDGFPTDQRNATAISPADIKSIEILKDASSIAIYGSRGANGVIIITTKSGREGKSQLNLDVSTGFSQVVKHDLIDVASAKNYVQYYKEFYTQNGRPIPNAIANWDGKTDTRWQDLVYKTGAFRNISLSANGGNDKISYLVSGNYIKQDGILIGEGYDKYSMRLKVDYRPSDKFTFGINLAPNFTVTKRSSYTTDELSGQNLAFLADIMSPLVPVRRANGTYAQTLDILTETGIENIVNPLYMAENFKMQNNRTFLLSNAFVEFEPIKNLVFKSTLGANISYDRRKVFFTKRESQNLAFAPNQSTLSELFNETIGWLNENTVSYKRTFNNVHAVTALAGFTAQRTTFHQLNGGIDTYPINGPETFAFGTFANRSVGSSESANSLLSYLGRATYSYKSKYLFTGTVRRDGSSRFGINNRYHTFASGGLGWVLSKESFMQNIKFINNAKIRASYGTSGSNDISDFPSIQSLVASNHSFNGGAVNGVANSAPGNPSLTWETSKQLDLGLDFTGFNNRIDITFDYYDRLTDGLILQANLPLSSGFPGFLTNVGAVRNKGFEVSLNANIINQNDFKWSIGGNISHNDQKVEKLGLNQTEVFNFFGALKSRIGGELQQISAVKVIGVVKPGEVVPGQPGAKPGDLKFQDTNKDGVITDFLGNDAVFLGDPNIDWNYGFNTTVSYKNFEFYTLWQGQSGGSLFDLYLIQNSAGAGGPRNFSEKYFFNGRYIDNTNQGDGKTPSASGLFNSGNGQGPVSSFGVQKTDFLRIRNISLSYELPQSLISKYGVQRMRAFISADNVFTFKKFIGANPSATGFTGGGPGLIGGSRIPGVAEPREQALGTVSSSAIPRTITFGLNITF